VKGRRRERISVDGPSNKNKQTNKQRNKQTNKQTEKERTSSTYQSRDDTVSLPV